MEFMLENTRVIIHDMYCRNQNEEQRARIMKRVSDIVYGALLRQMSEKEKQG